MGQTIVQMLSFKPGTFITGDKITEKLLKVYKRLGINKPLFSE